MKLARRLAAEGIGSLLLAATVVGSGVMAERLAGGNSAIALLANTAATVAVLATLIALLAPISQAHFNPAVSFVEALRGSLSAQPIGSPPRRPSPIQLSPSRVRSRIPSRGSGR